MNEEVIYPNHVGIILDGNGRWAEEKGLNRSMGHQKGYENLRDLSLYILNKTKVKFLSVFIFSTDNFKRSKEEVDFLMNLFRVSFNKDSKVFEKENIKVIFSGVKDPLPNDVWSSMEYITEKTKNNIGGVLNFCLNYGGQEEIVDAVKKITNEVIKGNLLLEDINKFNFSKYLYNDLPPIDFLIRTSGEERISNFMIYQASYAEFYFPSTYFPDFDKHAFDESIKVYNKRDRRFGTIKK
ncbi:MAG: polyprenyl diphosphate synthase [Bacilli bacterium]